MFKNENDYVYIKMVKCADEKCNESAIYGIDLDVPTHCPNHRPSNKYMNTYVKRCEHDDCKRVAYFGKDKRTFCKEHKAPDHVAIRSDLCFHIGCNMQASYKSKSTGQWSCATHKLEDSVSQSVKCFCGTHASFGLEKHKPLTCKEHKQSNYIDVTHDMCKHGGCNKRASYGPKHSTPIFCATHKQQDHVNDTSKKCEYPTCDIIASYGFNKKRRWCKEHKQTGAIDILNACKQCSNSDCRKRASFGPKGGNPIYCAKHCESEHVDLVSKKCSADDCYKQPHFGPPGGKPTTCASHKEHGFVELINKLCQHTNCNTRANYGKLFGPPIHCFKHKQKNDYKGKERKPKCVSDKCKARPAYTDDESNYPKRCEDHKLEDDVNVVEQKCVTCGIENMINTATGKCNNCTAFMQVKQGRRKYKEDVIAALFDEHKIELTHDKIPVGSCNKYRPDFVIDCGTHFVIIEVDEHQHSGYQCECEQARMINVCQDLGGGMPVTFIRYNPDDYKAANGKWIRRKNKAPRHKKLMDVVKSCMQHMPDHLLGVIYLYYNGHDDNKLDINIIDMDLLTVQMERL